MNDGLENIRELYQQVIIDHGRNPRNFGHLDGCTHRKDGFNPLCGDKLTLCLKLQDGAIVDAKFEGEGCAISTASASLMTQAVKGLTVTQAETLFNAFQQMAVQGNASPEVLEQLGKLSVLRGVCAFPARVKCATLAWHTLDAALRGDAQPVSTE
jgi:nitrogen fixation NifU-like protein